MVIRPIAPQPPAWAEPVLGPQLPQDVGKKTLVLDLGEAGGRVGWRQQEAWCGLEGCIAQQEAWCGQQEAWCGLEGYRWQCCSRCLLTPSGWLDVLACP